MSLKTSYSGSFESAVKIVLGVEGGYVNDPLDAGGETKFGISKRSYPTLDIKNLTLEQAREIYRRDYWNKLLNIEPHLKLMAFDAAVNQGLSFSNKISQEILNISMLTNQGQIDYFYSARINRYNDIVLKRPAQKRFYEGWINRLDDINQISSNYLNISKGGLS